MKYKYQDTKNRLIRKYLCLLIEIFKFISKYIFIYPISDLDIEFIDAANHIKNKM